MSEKWMFEIPPSIVEHPDFAKGLPIGRDCYLYEDQRCKFTLAEILERIEKWLSRKLYAHAMRYERMHKLSHLSFAYDVGSIVGWLSTLLSDLPPLDAIFLIFALETHASGKKILRCLPEAGAIF